MRKSFLLLVVVAAGLLATSLARAQGVGTLSGHVYDQTGVPLRGVRVEISSPVLVGGNRSVVSNDEGVFYFPGLLPGKYKILATAPKLRTLVQENVKVSQGSTMEVDLVMDIETGTEEIKIVTKAPVVNTSSSKIGESFDAEFMDSLPLASRSYQGVAALAAGVNDISGNGNPQMRGGTYFSNSYTVDGFETTDPVTNTFGMNFSFGAMSDVEISTANFGAENSDVLGGVVNIVTKSGSNRFEVDADAEYTDHNLRLFTDARDADLTFRSTTVNLGAGGPVIRDRLWYYATLSGRQLTFNLPELEPFPKHPAYRSLSLKGFGKLTWQLSSRDKIELSGNFSPAAFNNDEQSYLVEPEAESRSFQRAEFLNLQWHSFFDEVYLNGRVNYTQEELNTRPQSCDWDPQGCETISAETDIATGILRKNYPVHYTSQRRSYQLAANADWIKDTKRFGGHHVRGGVVYRGAQEDKVETRSGNASYYSVGAQPFARSEYCSNDPKLEEGLCRQNAVRSRVTGGRLKVFLTDEWKPTRYFSITPGVAFNAGRSENDAGVSITGTRSFTPHLAAIWDPTHDGKTKLTASFNGSVDPGFLQLGMFASRNLYERDCTWDEGAQAYVRDCRSSGGDGGLTVGKPCGPEGRTPDGQVCTTTLQAPRLWELTLGGEREVLTSIAVGVNFVYRLFTNAWEDVETNANWNQSGSELRRDQRYKSGRTEFIFDLQTPDSAQRRYKSVTAFMRKREGILKSQISYTWTRYEGVADNSFASLYLDNPGQTQYYYGPLQADMRHDFRALVSYSVFPWLSVGATYIFQSGQPYNRYYWDSVFNTYGRFQAHRGYDSRGTIDPDDDVELRLPDRSSFDLKVQASLEPLIKQRAGVWIQGENLLALRTATRVIQTDGEFWNRVVGWTPPLTVSMGAFIRY